MATYVPRLNSDGMQGNLHWYSSGNPFYASGYGLPNCTCYAYGRFWEIGDPNNTGENNPVGLPRGDGGQWWNNSTTYIKGYEPQLGAVICFAGNPGHVAIVEGIDPDGTITTSNSDWGGQYFYLRRIARGNNNYGCQGFIYNPYAGGVEPEPVEKKKGHYKFILFNRRKRFNNGQRAIY